MIFDPSARIVAGGGLVDFVGLSPYMARRYVRLLRDEHLVSELSRVMDTDDVREFQEFLKGPGRSGQQMSVLVLVGSGLSQASGLPAYNTSSDYDNVWRNYTVIDLATLDAFDSNPAIVWLFYALRRSQSLRAQPNNGHRVLAQLSHDKRYKSLTITQTMDRLHQRADHDSEKLVEFYGSWFTEKCTSFFCNFKRNNYNDPITPSLDTSKYSNPDVQLPKITAIDELPTCPICHSLLRPGVLFFGEPLPLSLIDKVDEFMINNPVDLLLVIGTSHSCWPASAYIDMVRNQGGNIAVFNTIKDREIEENSRSTKVWQFIGDCSVTLPQVLGPIFNDDISL